MVKTKPFIKRLFISTIGPTQSRLKFDSLFWEINFYQNLGDLLKSSQVWIDIWPVAFELWEWPILSAYNILDFRRLTFFIFILQLSHELWIGGNTKYQSYLCGKLHKFSLLHKKCSVELSLEIIPRDQWGMVRTSPNARNQRN